MKFIDGYVYLFSGQAKFRITTVPKRDSQSDEPMKYRINAK